MVQFWLVSISVTLEDEVMEPEVFVNENAEEDDTSTDNKVLGMNEKAK